MAALSLAGTAHAVFLADDQLFLNPWMVPFADYDRVYINSSWDGFQLGDNSYTWGYTDVENVSVLPLLNPYSLTDPGRYPTSYAFTQSDYRYKPNQHYWVDLTSGVATATFHGSGIYHVQLHRTTGPDIIQAVFMDTGFIGDGEEPQETGPEVEIQGPVADLVIVSENGENGDVLDDAANLAEEDNPGRVERATSVQDMVDAIEQAYFDNGMNPIHVELVAHGAPGHFRIGHEGVGNWDDDEMTMLEFQELLDGMVDGLSTYSCNFAKGDEGRDALIDLAGSLGWASGWDETVTAHWNEEYRGWNLELGGGLLTEVPEPSSLVLALVCGLVGCIHVRLRGRRT
jgi:hypothetical protein